MSLRFSDVMTGGDWGKLGFLILVAGLLWTWVYVEYRKPFPTDIANAQVEHIRE